MGKVIDSGMLWVIKLSAVRKFSSENTELFSGYMPALLKPFTHFWMLGDEQYASPGRCSQDSSSVRVRELMYCCNVVLGIFVALDAAQIVKFCDLTSLAAIF